MEKETIDILIVDDHDLFREGVISLLESEKHIKISGEAANWNELKNMLENKCPDIILLDINLPDKSGIEIAHMLYNSNPEIRIIILSANLDEDSVFNAINAGVHGYLPKDISKVELITAINQVNDGKEYYSDAISTTIFRNYLRFAKAGRKQSKDREVQLTEREKEIIKHFAEGLSYKEIGARLNISVRTVESHKNNIFEKLELKTIVDLVKYAIRTGLSKV